MDFFNSVANFFGSIETGIGNVANWLFGTDEGMGEDYGTSGVISDIFGYGDSFLSSSSPAGKLAASYLTGIEEKEKRKPQDFLIKIGEGPGATTAARTAAPRFVGENNQAFRNAVNRLASRTNLNPQTADIARTYLTVQQGRRTLGTPSPTVSRVAAAPAASVRTASKEVDIA